MDHTTSLRWVRAEVDSLLARARQALQDLAEDGGNGGEYTLIQDVVHQARLVLELLELYGGSLALEEIEGLVHSLASDSIDKVDDAQEVLMRALLQLPDYLEQIETGKQDNALLLMPLLNDLRAVRKLGLYSENSLFTPRLDIRIDSLGESVIKQGKAGSKALQGYARKLRPHYQKGLVEWFRNTATEVGLKRMAAVIAHLEKVSGDEPMGRLWYITAGLIEALLDERIDASVSVKLLMGQVDRRIKALVDNGGDELTQAQPLDLQKNLLYYLAQSGPGGERAQQVHEQYQLSELVPAAPADTLSLAPGLAIMDSVNEAVKEDLASVQDMLDFFVRATDPELAALAPAVDTLNRISDTLGLMGLGALRKRVQLQAIEMQDIVDADELPDHDRLLGIAAGVIDAGTVLEAIANKGLEAGREQDDEESVELSLASSLATQFERENLLTTLVGEAKTELASVREAVTAFLAQPGHTEHLEGVDEHMARVEGALSMLSLPRAAQLVYGCGSYVHDILAAPGHAPTTGIDPELQNFADALVGMEYYLDALAERRQDTATILDLVNNRLVSIGIDPQTARAEDNEELPGELPAPVADSLREAAERIDQMDTETPVDGEPEPPAVSHEVRHEATIGDPEILAIFAEEADEVIATVGSTLDGWQDGADNTDAIVTIRRSFHTLKGSGRLVGASVIGELAWNIERMLNRVIEHTIGMRAEMLELIKEVHADLPALVQAFRDHSDSDVPVAAYTARANALETAPPETPGDDEDDDEPPPEGGGDDPGGADAPGDTAGEDADEGTAAGRSDSAENALADVVPLHSDDARAQADADDDRVIAQAEPDGLIPRGFYDTGLHDILQIFLSEARGHQGVIEVSLVSLPGETLSVSDDLVRACHTLGGAAKVAKLPNLSALFSQLETMLGHYQRAALPLEHREGELLRQCNERLRLTLDELADGGGDMPPDPALLAEISELNEWAEMQPSGGSEADSQEQTPAAMHDPELLAVFLDEAEELLETCDSTLAGWDDEDQDRNALLADLQRHLHTLKGGARIAGLGAIGDLAHDLESVLVNAGNGKLPVNAALKALVQDSQDGIASMIDMVVGNQTPQPNTELNGRLYRALAGELAEAEPFTDTSTRNRLETATEALVDEALVDEAPVDEAPVDEAPVDEAPVGEAPVDEAPVDEAPVGEEPVGEEPVGEAPVDELPVDATTERNLDDDIIDADNDVTMELPVAASDAAREDTVVSFEAAARSRRPVPGPSNAPGNDDAVTPEPAEKVQVLTDTLDNLVNFAGEINISRSRLEQQVGDYKLNLGELDSTLERLREQLRGLEIQAESQISYADHDPEAPGEDFDPLEFDRFTQMQELARGLMETVSDLESIKALMGDLTRESESVLLQQSRVNTDLQHGLMNTRLVPVSRYIARLRRLVRQTSNDLGKQVEFHVSGQDEEVDHAILTRIVAPLEHMLRNALDHGIEDPEQRLQAGKPGSGNIRLSFGHEGTEVVIEVHDDGRGLDLDAIRRKAVERGDMDAHAELADEDLVQFILNQSFSTADEVTQISGRGVGMDVVNTTVKQLGGSLDIRSEAGQGTQVIIHLPTTLSITHALMVHAGDDLFAIPLANIEGIMQVSTAELRQLFVQERPSLVHLDSHYLLTHLGSMLGTGSLNLSSGNRRHTVLLMRTGGNAMGFIVDAISGRQEIVNKPLGIHVGSLQWIAGGSILGDGRVVLILDIPALIRRGIALPDNLGQVGTDTPTSSNTIPLVMVVDDSITVRKVTQRFLSRNGMQVILAKDGVEALGLLQDHQPDLMLLDVEMPRMDGYELATTIRNDERLNALPIIMITSRTGKKHADRALSIGVNRYLGKPYHEGELLESINEFLSEAQG